MSNIYDLIPDDSIVDSYRHPYFVVLPVPGGVIDSYGRMAEHNVRWADFKTLIMEGAEEILNCPDMVMNCPVDPNLSVYVNFPSWNSKQIMEISREFRRNLVILHAAMALHGLFYDYGGVARSDFSVHSLTETGSGMDLILHYCPGH